MSENRSKIIQKITVGPGLPYRERPMMYCTIYERKLMKGVGTLARSAQCAARRQKISTSSSRRERVTHHNVACYRCSRRSSFAHHAQR